MHEFTSISVSSYDAASLADKLTEKSAAGWDVVAIVPAGTNITAYLSREAEAAETAPSSDASSDDTASATDAGAGESAPNADSTGGVTTSMFVDHDADEPAVEEPAPVWEAEPVAEEPAPVEEPAGWAVAPEPVSQSPEAAGVVEVSPEPTPYVDTTSGDSAAEPAEPAEPAEGGYVGEPQLGTSTAGYDTGTAGYDTGTAGYDTGTSSGATTEPSSDDDAGVTTEPSTGDESVATEPPTNSGHEAEVAAAATGYGTGVTAETDAVTSSEATASSAAEQTTTAAASAAPAGWYADPSGRYELRYWDGNQWTEHVSRAGQQYTDPPVA